MIILKEPAWYFLGPDRKMFLQSFPDHDVLGQAFEDALEVLQQHSDREMQCLPGNKHPYFASFPSSYFYRGAPLETCRWESNSSEVD